MAIPEQQLETWSHQGAVATARDTRASIYNALKGPKSKVANADLDVYLQGSYANATNTWASSDVDVVVQLDSTWFRDISALPPADAAAYQSSFSNAVYGWEDWRRDVVAVLKDYYGDDAVVPDDKCVRIKEREGRLPADVVPALLFRRYTRFRSPSDCDFVSGMGFINQANGQLVVNYPKLHRDNGEYKNAHQTAQWFKPLVRVFKNARNRAVAEGLLADGAAPSYFVECLIFNAPNTLFGTSYQSTFQKIVAWLPGQSADAFVCQNRQLPLFGSTAQQWTVEKASAFIGAMTSLWDQW